MNSTEYKQLKDSVAKLEIEVNRAEGAIIELEKRLKEEFGCSSVEDAEERLEDMNRNIEDLKEELDAEHKKFQEKWGSQL